MGELGTCNAHLQELVWFQGIMGSTHEISRVYSVIAPWYYGATFIRANVLSVLFRWLPLGLCCDGYRRCISVVIKL